MSASLDNGFIRFGDNSTMSTSSVAWGNLSGKPAFVYPNTKYNGNEQAGRAIYGGVGANCGGYGDFPQCNCGNYNCSGAYLYLDAGSSWDMYYYYYNCNCNNNCNCNCNCQCNC